MLYKFFKIQLESSSKTDWTTTCMNNLEELKVEKSLDEIREMSNMQYKNLLNEKVRKTAFTYLTEKQRSKGGDISYTDLHMAEYLMPNSNIQSNTVKREIFAIRNKMVNIPANYSSSKIEHNCKCGMREDMEHVYTCTMLNSKTTDIKFDEIYSSNTKLISEVNRRFQNNMNKREEINDQNEEEIKLKTHAILSSDPLYSIVYSIG